MKPLSLPLKVAIVGPESSGKTTLSRLLLERLFPRYRVALVEEYAREYYRERPYLPTAADVLAIAQGQCAAELAAGEVDILVCDSTVLTCLVWSEVGFGEVAPELEGLWQPHDYALTLLARPDIPWAPDPLRSHPDSRDDLLERYRRYLALTPGRCVEIYGEGEQRLALACDAIEAALDGR